MKEFRDFWLAVLIPCIICFVGGWCACLNWYIPKPLKTASAPVQEILDSMNRMEGWRVFGDKIVHGNGDIRIEVNGYVWGGRLAHIKLGTNQSDMSYLTHDDLDLITETYDRVRPLLEQKEIKEFLSEK